MKLQEGKQNSASVEVNLSGTPVFVRSGQKTEFWSEVSSGTWEPETFEILRRFLDPSRIYIDIGAWIGPTLLYACGRSRFAYGFEPDPVAYGELVNNLHRNPTLAARVTALQLCIAPQTGKVNFGNRAAAGDSTSSMLFGTGNTAWCVDAITFNDFASQYSISGCGFIKMDIEGGEYSVLPTMANFLRSERPTLFLSLHPSLIGARKRRGLGGNVVKLIAERLAATVSLLSMLRFYKHIVSGRRFAPHASRPTFFSRCRFRVDKLAFKPLVLLMTCLYSAYGNGITLVLTDRQLESQE